MGAAAPVIGAAGGIGSSILGGEAASDAANTNFAINMYNQQQEERARQDSKRFAEERIADQKLGSTDAFGNSTKFVEGQGWISQLSPQQQQLYNYFLSQELPERQAQFQRAAELSRGDADMAQFIMDQLQRVQRPDDNALAAQIYAQSARGIGEGAQDVAEAASRQGLRSGNANLGDILAKLGGKTMQQRSDAREDAFLKAKDYGDNKYDQERSKLAQLYGAFAGRADNPLGVSYDPSNISNGNSQLGMMLQQAAQGNAQGFNANAMTGGTFDYVTPDNGMANAIGGVGSSLEGMFTGLDGSRQRQQQRDDLINYMTLGGQLNPSSGIFGAVASRSNVGGGIF